MFSLLFPSFGFALLHECVDVENEHSENQSGRLIKQSCHDSGIDIRDPSLVGASRKTTYSDADILLSDAEFVPPKPLRPLSQGDDESSPSTRKSTSVSFSLEDSKDSSLENSSSKQPSVTDDADKQSTDSKKKNVSSLSSALFIFLRVSYVRVHIPSKRL